MSRESGFDELVGAEPTGGERERLRRAHDLLLEAGPPPELPPGLAHAPQPWHVTSPTRRRLSRRPTLLLAAAVAVAVVFAAGYAIGEHGGGTPTGTLLALKGTAAAPHARATLDVLPGHAGNWPMKLTVENLPKLPAGASYDVYLLRGGDRYLSCGSFVSNGGTKLLTVTLNAPYRLRSGDRWVVTRESPHESGHGATVLRPA